MKKKLKCMMETNNYVVIYSVVNGSTLVKAGATIWIHNSVRNTIINKTHLSEE
jgi:hypothetical protein